MGILPSVAGYRYANGTVENDVEMTAFCKKFEGSTLWAFKFVPKSCLGSL